MDLIYGIESLVLEGDDRWGSLFLFQAAGMIALITPLIVRCLACPSEPQFTSILLYSTQEIHVSLEAGLSTFLCLTGQHPLPLQKLFTNLFSTLIRFLSMPLWCQLMECPMSNYLVKFTGHLMWGGGHCQPQCTRLTLIFHTCVPSQ